MHVVRAKRFVRVADVAAGAIVAAGVIVSAGCGQQGVVRPGANVPSAATAVTGHDGLVTGLHVPLDRILRISRFRSGAGHDYSDGVERCRSMKHYFQFTGGEPGEPHEPSWATVPVVSPLDGVVVGIDEEWAGDQIRIRSTVDPRYTLVVFHVRRASGVVEGVDVKAGQALGSHAGDETMSDLAVEFEDPSLPHGRRLISAFDVMGDDAFAALTARGVAGRAALIIGQAERDREPLGCDGERFTSASGRADWVELSTPSDPPPGLTPTP